MLLDIFLLVAFTSYAYAQMETIIMDIFGPDQILYKLSSEENALATYLIACTAGTVQTTGYRDWCDYVQPETVIQGATNMIFNITGIGQPGVESAPDTTRTLSYSCDFASTTSVNCTMTGGARRITGPSSTVVTPVDLTWSFTGYVASEQFASIPVLTNSSLLLTYTPPGALITGLTTLAKGVSTSWGDDSTEVSTTARPTASRTVASMTSVSLSHAGTSTKTASSTSLISSTETVTPFGVTASSSATTGGGGIVSINRRKAWGAIIAVALVFFVL